MGEYHNMKNDSIIIEKIFNLDDFFIINHYLIDIEINFTIFPNYRFKKIKRYLFAINIFPSINFFYSNC